jgi:hypothetical protein
VLQLKSAKQLSVGGYDDGGQAHCDRPHTQGEIESPVDEKAGSDRNSDKVVGRLRNRERDRWCSGAAAEESHRLRSAQRCQTIGQSQ